MGYNYDNKSSTGYSDHDKNIYDYDKYKCNSDKKIKYRYCQILCHGPTFIIPKDKMPSKNEHPSIYTVQILRRLLLCLICTILIGNAIAIALNVLVISYKAVPKCENYTSNGRIGFSRQYPHLYVWNECNYKVYPLSEDMPCQCRELIVRPDIVERWEQNDNITREEAALIFSSILEEFFMLETLSFAAHSSHYINQLNWTESMTNARGMKILHVESVNIPIFTSQFGNSFQNLEFLSLLEINIRSADTNSWKSMNKLKWFNLTFGTIELNVNTTQFLCHWPDVQVVGFDGFGSVTLPRCISNLDNLKWLDIDQNAFDLRGILDKPGLIGINAEFGILNIDEIENYTDWNFDTMNQLSGIYLQNSNICDLYNTAPVDFYNRYPNTWQLLNRTRACESICTLARYEFYCKAHVWQNGVCDDDCNNVQCNYDGGDCNQLCNFTQCDYSWLGDGICNPECHNQECSWDYCDCYSPNNYNQSTTTQESELCFFNTTQCSIATNYTCRVDYYFNNLSLTNFVDPWPGDDVCDSNCNVQECQNDNRECDDCEYAPVCNTLMDYFDTVSATTGQDYLISQDEFCAILILLEQQFGPDGFQRNITCKNLLIESDQNNDGFLNAYEVLYMYFFYTTGDQAKADQVNCSLCMTEPNDYYKSANVQY